jgi:hypothetical protein
MLWITVQKGKRIDPDNPWPGRQNRDKLQLLATGGSGGGARSTKLAGGDAAHGLPATLSFFMPSMPH